MRNDSKIIQFNVNGLSNVQITHGYNIINAFPIHFHSSFNLGIVEQGCREFWYRGNWNRLIPNDIFIIQPLEPHCCKSPDGPHSYKIISFEDTSHLFYPDLIIRQSDLSERIHTFHQIVQHESQSLQLKSLFENLMAAIHPFSIQQTIDNNETFQRMAKAKAFIEANCLRELSLKEMADSVYLSEFYFNRQFHQCYGLSPYTYYLITKIKRSQQVLKQTQSIIEAGYDVGFFDQSHFTKEFKKQVGVTPGRFLRDNS